MGERENYTHYYTQLKKICGEKYPHNPDGVLMYHLTHRKLSIETSILLLASENGIRIPEVQARLADGATLEAACTELTQRAEFEDVLSIYEERKRESKAYVRISIDQITYVAHGRRVAVYGRVVALYVGTRIGGKATGRVMQFTVSDGSGMILVEAKQAEDDELPVGRLVFWEVWLRGGLPESPGLLVTEDLGDLPAAPNGSPSLKKFRIVLGIVK